MQQTNAPSQLAPSRLYDEGWPYSDLDDGTVAEDEIDLDLLELRADPHAYDSLTSRERDALTLRYGFVSNRPMSMKEVARSLGLTYSETREALGTAISKLRKRLISQ